MQKMGHYNRQAKLRTFAEVTKLRRGSKLTNHCLQSSQPITTQPTDRQPIPDPEDLSQF